MWSSTKYDRRCVVGYVYENTEHCWEKLRPK